MPELLSKGVRDRLGVIKRLPDCIIALSITLEFTNIAYRYCGDKRLNDFT